MLVEQVRWSLAAVEGSAVWGPCWGTRARQLRQQAAVRLLAGLGLALCE